MAETPERTFPVLLSYSDRKVMPSPVSRIPWSVAERAYAAYAARYGTLQSLERLAERGGFGPSELDEFAPGWREEVTEIARLRAEVASLRGERDKLLDGYPEGCTPTDFRVLREGNVALAAEVEALRGERGRYKAALEEIGRRIDQAPTYRMASDVARIVTHALAALTPTEDRP